MDTSVLPKCFLLIAEEDDDPLEDRPFLDPLLESPEDVGSSQAQISLHTLLGHLAPETLHLVGLISG